MQSFNLLSIVDENTFASVVTNELPIDPLSIYLGVVSTKSNRLLWIHNIIGSRYWCTGMGGKMLGEDKKLHKYSTFS